VHNRSMRRFIAILMSGALASKLLGFAREILMAQLIGASLVADSFRSAITAIMLPLVFMQNESVPAILIPMHRDFQKEGKAPQHLAALTVALTSIAFILMMCVEALGARWVSTVVSGFSSEGKTLTLDFVRILALGMPASTMLNCLAAGEIALGRTRLTNIRASLLNVSALIGIGLLALTGNVDILAWSFSIAFNVLAAWGLLSLWWQGILNFEGLTPNGIIAAGLAFLRRLRPLLALPLAEQGNVWIERFLASNLVTGAIASLDYARTLTESSLLLVSQPMGLAVLSADPHIDLRSQIVSIARPVLALALPASVFLFMFAPEIVRLVFFRGAFGEEAVFLTSQALRGISFGLWAATLGWILIRILNSAGRNSLAAIIIVSGYAANILVNLMTSSFQTASGSGVLLLGLGEAARGIVLLCAVAFVLESRRVLTTLVLLATIPASFMAVLGWQIHLHFAGTVERLLAGGVAYVACTIVAATLLIPGSYVFMITQIRNGFGRSGNRP
jgi:putative peptidoglycan lipid II flippase